MSTTDNAYELYKTHSKKDEKGNITINKSQITKFMNEEGITDEIIQKMTKVEKALSMGAYRYGSEQLLEKAKSMKDDGKDPQEAVVSVTSNLPTGVNTLTLSAAKTYRVSTFGRTDSEENKTVTKYNTVRDVTRRTSHYDKEVMAEYEEKMRKFLGL